jgi:hypothetical protein
MRRWMFVLFGLLAVHSASAAPQLDKLTLP